MEINMLDLLLPGWIGLSLLWLAGYESGRRAGRRQLQVERDAAVSRAASLAPPF